MLLVSKTLYPPGEPPVVQIPSAAPNLFSVDPHVPSQTAKPWEKPVGERPFPDGYIYPYNIWDFTPPSFFCPHDLERVGSLGDGGKVFCGMSRYERESLGPSSAANGAPELIVYTFGISGDSSFEAALLERTNALIWGAKDISEQQARRTRFQKVAIGKGTDETSNPAVRSIQDLIKENGHSYIDLIRMGIEGAEFDFISSFIASVVASQGGSGAENNATLPAGQLLMELHFMKAPPSLTIPRDLDSWMRWFADMETVGSRPVNNEDNWIGDVGTGNPGLWSTL
ncbi:hypothetical protein BDV11DRAFT_175678 [Aspergillus similis]